MERGPHRRGGLNRGRSEPERPPGRSCEHRGERGGEQEVGWGCRCADTRPCHRGGRKRKERAGEEPADPEGRGEKDGERLRWVCFLRGFRC